MRIARYVLGTVWLSSLIVVQISAQSDTGQNTQTPTTTQATTTQNTATQTGTTDEQSVRQNVEQLRNAYSQAVSKGDVQTLADFFADDAVILPPMQPAITGKEAIRSDFGRSFAKYNETIKIQSEEFHVAGDWAYDRGTTTETLTPKTGGNPIIHNGRYLVLLRKESDGTWKLSRLMINLAEPPPAGVMRTE